MAVVHETYEFDVPVERLDAHLSDHENLKPLLGLNITRVKEGETNANGVGSVRRLSAKGLLPFEETVTEAIPNERIEYRATKERRSKTTWGSWCSRPPARAAATSTTRSPYTAAPGLDKLIAAGVGRSLRRGLLKAARALS